MMLVRKVSKKDDSLDWDIDDFDHAFKLLTKSPGDNQGAIAMSHMIHPNADNPFCGSPPNKNSVSRKPIAQASVPAVQAIVSSPSENTVRIVGFGVFGKPEKKPTVPDWVFGKRNSVDEPRIEPSVGRPHSTTPSRTTSSLFADISRPVRAATDPIALPQAIRRASQPISIR